MAMRTFVEINQSPDSRFYLCRTCHTLIAWSQEVVYMHIPTETLIVQNVENVLIDRNASTRRGNRITVVSAYCAGCSSFLGNILVEVDMPDTLFQKGRYLLNFDSLLYWNGHRIIDPMDMM